MRSSFYFVLLLCVLFFYPPFLFAADSTLVKNVSVDDNVKQKAKQEVKQKAKQQVDAREATYAIGLNMGAVVGNGLGVRSYTKKGFFQLTYSGYVEKSDDAAYFNVSATYARYLVKAKATRNILPLGLKLIMGGGAVYDSFLGQKANEINAGVGVGVDFGSVGKEGVMYSFNMIYALSFKGLRAPEFSSLDFTPTLGLLYNVN